MLEAELVPGDSRQLTTFRRVAGSRFAGTIRGARAEYDEQARSLRVDGAETSAWSASSDAAIAGVVTITFRMEGPYTRYPVRVYLYRKDKDDDSRQVGESPFAYVRGHVPVNGRTMLVEFQYRWDRSTSYLDEGWQGMDLNGDGVIDTHPRSVEWVHANDERPVFGAGEVYLSAKSIDLAKRQIVLRANGANEYRRIDLTPGNVVPDFAFTDMAGRTRKLSEIDARYVLLDFWAVWCGPCIRDWEHVKPVWERYRSKGFEVLGLHPDADDEAAAKLVEAKKLPWIVARGATVRHLVEKQFRIGAYPQYVLLDRERRIVSASEELRGEKLAPTLARLIR
ncbi:MAG: TlpA disulfide reductase family protein [Bryobacteraceae bacterium]